MFVVKRDGRREDVHFDKITSRIKRLAYGLSEYVEPIRISQKVVMGVYPGVTTSELDNLAAETAAYMATEHPEYAILAARIAVSNLHKNTKKIFSETVKDLYEYVDVKTGRSACLIDQEVYDIICKNKEKLDSALIYDRDYSYDYFGFKTLERSYLLRIHGRVVERPQHMLMRVAVGIHKSDLEAAIETYNLMSLKFFTHASPTLFNSGTPHPQLSSCFLVAMKDDSIEGIYDTLKTCAMISKSAGGIGLHIHNIRARSSYIRGTNGTSNGLVPMLRVFNATARYVDQGGGKRPGAFALYLEPWHADILEFLDMRKNTGAEESRARDLFFGLWIPDLFMARVEADADWSLFCPVEAVGLADTFGKEFEALYLKYEAEGKARRTVRAQDIWFAILESQIETGTPYLLYKDAANEKSNQKNLGIIKSSNLCTEIIEYSSPDEVAVCNLASVSLPRFVVTTAATESSPEKSEFDHQKLAEVVQVMTRNLNKVIDVNQYPVPEAKKSNLRHRPIGLGVQGLADVFMLLRMPFESPEARALNKEIFETIYFASLTSSCALAKELGTYETYAGCPLSQGILQQDMWGVEAGPRWNWDKLRADIKQHGVRNSLLVAPMPTASTSQILGNNECFEPYTSNLYVRRVVAGEFAVVNPHLLKDLQDLGLWSSTMKQKIMAANGSIQGITTIPEHIRAIYKTAWEISQRAIIDLAADRGAFIDQSQSLNLFIAEPNFGRLTSMHFYAWKKGLKTGCYYLRVRPAMDAIKFTVDQDKIREHEVEQRKEQMACSLANREACISCSG